LIATGEWGVCLFSTCKVRYPQNKNILRTYVIDDMKLRYSKLVLFDTEKFVLQQIV